MRYKTSFSSKVRCLISDEKDTFLSKASLDNLKNIIPDSYKDQIDLLAIAFNSCTPNLGNKNGDMIDSAIALDIYQKFISRPINIEHGRNNGALGHIVSAGFSKFDINYTTGSGSELIEASEIKDKTEPFNLSLAGVLYRLYSPNVIAKIEESSNPDSETYMAISASWELMFESFVLAVGSKYLAECEIIDDPQKIEELSKHLSSLGGTGKLPDGRPVYRLLRGNVVPAGIGLTMNPAGELAGIYTEQEDKSLAKNNSDSTIVKEKTENNENKISHLEKEDVKERRIMKINKLTDITDELLKEAKASAIHEFVESELRKAISEYETKEKEAKSALAKEEEARKVLAKEQEDLTKKLQEQTQKFEDLSKQLQAMVQEKEAKAKEEAFSVRMSKLDEKYNLSDEDRKIIASQVKELDEEAWAAYEKNAEILFREKAKKTEIKTEATASAATVVDDALDNAAKEKAGLPNTSTASEPTLYDKYKKAFSLEDGFEISDNRKRK